MELLEGARKLIGSCAGVERGETVLVVIEPEETQVARALADAVRERDGVPLILMTDALRLHGVEPPIPVVAAMEAANVVLAMTRGSLSQTRASVSALAKGARMISFPGATQAMLTAGLIEADPEALSPVVRAVADALEIGDRIHVTAPGGTHLTLDIRGRRGRALDGICRRPGTSMSMSFEANVGPREGTARGMLVVDGSLPEVGALDAPIVMTIEEGRIMAITGGLSAERFRRFLEERGDPLLSHVGEFGIGLNPRAKLTGTSYLEDESAYGTAHIGFGTNVKQGGTILASGHIDAVFLSPTIEVDGKAIMQAGRLLLASVE